MERSNAAERAAWLRAQIAENSDLYYNSDAPKISDFEYDAMFEELRSIEAAFPELDSPDSPTHRVGGKASEKFSKVTHRVPLGSLTDVFDRESLEDFVRRMKETLGDGVRFTVEPKIDGLSVAAEYRGGKLIRAATRGDGKVGEDITENARTIASLPKEVAYGGNFCVRGEVYMPRATFFRINAENEENGEKVFANPRNAAAGSAFTPVVRSGAAGQHQRLFLALRLFTLFLALSSSAPLVYWLGCLCSLAALLVV